MTRDEYMQQMTGQLRSVQADLHRQYYAQFVVPWTIEIVERWIGTARILRSTDPHFNDIPLGEWDRLDPIIRPMGARMNLKLNGASVWSVSDTVCVVKEAARQLKERNNGTPSNND